MATFYIELKIMIVSIVGLHLDNVKKNQKKELAIYS